MKKTLYQLLDVTPDASAEDIAAAYDKAKAALEQSVSPDPNQAIILREAFQLLSHWQKRAAYDAGLIAKETAAATVSMDQRLHRTAPSGGWAQRWRWHYWAGSVRHQRSRRHNEQVAPFVPSAPVLVVEAAGHPHGPSSKTRRLPRQPQCGRTLRQGLRLRLRAVNVMDDRGNLEPRRRQRRGHRRGRRDYELPCRQNGPET